MTQHSELVLHVQEQSRCFKAKEEHPFVLVQGERRSDPNGGLDQLYKSTKHRRREGKMGFSARCFARKGPLLLRVIFVSVFGVLLFWHLLQKGSLHLFFFLTGNVC